MDLPSTGSYTYGIAVGHSEATGNLDHEHGAVDAGGNPAIISLHHKVDQLRTLMDITNANARIITFNSRYERGDLRPLQKIVHGHGLALAQVAAQGLNSAVQQGIAAPPSAPAIGTTPPNFKPDTISYEHTDILEMIVFYNEDFGIVPNDDIWTRINKFREFLFGR
ncbi:hypothetical protein BD779DRAFT_1801736 [Infundibulicybe gibba]|nr:hypothetical protein BD779DRAFT_1801736 [Infundibulicybe gibba]